MTEKLYEDAYIQSFTATVQTCEQKGARYEVTLDRTAFFPVGGGQPADGGMLGEHPVLDVYARDDTVIHLLDVPLPPGSETYGEIDWPLRFSRMQHHTGEHIVSGLIHKRHGLNNVGFHMGRDAVTIDLSGELTWEQLLEIELLANKAVWTNLPVEISHPAPEALEQIQYRSKLDLHGDVRIVTVPGCDTCACCGTHVRETGEIGVIKLLDSQRYKGGVRVSLLCGARALRDYEIKNNAIKEIASSLSVKLPEAKQAVVRARQELAQAQARCAQLQEETFRLRAQSMEEAPFGLVFTQDLEPDALRRFALALCRRFPWAAVFSGAGQGWKYALAGNETHDVRPANRALGEAFGGRGGGKPALVQGSLSHGTIEEISAFLEKQP